MPSIPSTYAISQLEWWQKLPPTNLIERGDRIRFCHALYLMVHQVATVLLGINGQPDQMSFPSILCDARNRFDNLLIVPEATGHRLEQIIATADFHEAWNSASSLIQDVLTLVEPADLYGVISIPSIKIDRSPDQLNALAKAIGARYSMLPGVDAIALSGSLARGTADRLSDVDLSVYCRAYPSDQDRQTLLAALPDASAPLIEHACDTIWVEGTLVHIRYWLTDDVVKLITNISSPPEDFSLAEDLQICLPLYDPSGLLQQWKINMQILPGALIDTLVSNAGRRRLVFTRLWHEAKTQQDMIHLFCLANQAAHDWLRVLFALNHRFLSSPRWARHTIQTFSILPQNVEPQLFKIVMPMNEEMEGRWNKMENLWKALLEFRSR